VPTGKLFQVLITRYVVVCAAMKFFVVTFLVTVTLMITATFVQEVSAGGGSCSKY